MVKVVSLKTSTFSCIATVLGNNLLAFPQRPLLAIILGGLGSTRNISVNAQIELPLCLLVDMDSVKA